MNNIKENIDIDNFPNPVSIKATEKILFQMKNCICQIYKDSENIGIGYLCKIQYKNNNNYLPVLH